MSRRRRRLVPFGAFLLRWVVPLLSRTYRVVIHGKEVLEEATAAGQPVIFALWHNRSFALAPLFLSLHRNQLPICLLASHSRDGELLARTGRALGFRVERGSSSRGGRQAIRSLYRALREGYSPIAAADGPRGPLYEAKPGALVLAQLTQAKVVAISCATARKWELGSWDRLWVPKPWARIDVVVEALEPVPRAIGSEELEGRRRDLARNLDELGSRAHAVAQGSSKSVAR